MIGLNACLKLNAPTVQGTSEDAYQDFDSNITKRQEINPKFQPCVAEYVLENNNTVCTSDWGMKPEHKRLTSSSSFMGRMERKRKRPKMVDVVRF